MPKRNRNNQTPPPKRRKIELSDEAVTVVVGEDEKRVLVHKNLLCGTSSFFQTSCNGQWSESKDKTVKLREADPESFAIYANWLYTGQLDVLHDDAGCIAPFQIACKATNLLTDGWFLGDFLGDQVYCNAVTDTLVDLASKYSFNLSLGHVKDNWSLLPKHCGLRRLMVDMQVISAEEDELREIGSEMPHEFLVEFAVALMMVPSYEGGISPRSRPQGYYHDKTKGAKPQKP